MRGEQVFVGYPDGALGALDRRGNELWLADLGNGEDRLRDVDTTPLVAGDAVYAASFSGGLYRVNRLTGAIEWRLDVTGATTPIAVGDYLITTTASGSVLWIDPATGDVRSELKLDDDAAGPAVRAGDYLLVGEPNDGLYVLAASRPWIHARFQPDSGFSSNAVASGDTVFALSDAGFAYAFRLVAVGR
ncbi:MAG: outer membrane protein assembly factor BamB [Bradymonadia bacterium]|jgi:outer membrane protein assembly factor BamB